MKDIGVLLKNLRSIYVTAVMLTGMKRQALNECKVVIIYFQNFRLYSQFTYQQRINIYQIQD